MASGKFIADEIEREIAASMSPLSDAELKAIGDEAINVIVLRTKAGLDADRKAFKPYSDGYKKQREAMGRSSDKVDLSVSGHMQQGMISEPHDHEVSVVFLNPTEEKKAEIHNSGVDKVVSVRSHRRAVYINAKTGQRVSRKEAALDRKRKNKRVATKTEAVSTFSRHQKTPQREWFDIRNSVDVDIVQTVIEDKLKARR